MSAAARGGRRFAFITSNGIAWGGSEELWSSAAIALARDGHDVSVFKGNVDESVPAIRRLREAGCTVTDMSWFPLMRGRLRNAFAQSSFPLLVAQRTMRMRALLRFARPDLVVISQGGNLDGLVFARLCRGLRLPYVLISQKATDMYWPNDRSIASRRAAFSDALACYFVSQHNLRLTEEQIGAALPRAEVVRNPFLVPWTRRTDWPDESRGFRLACVGRMYPPEKGQDILLRVLARDRWRARPLHVTFFGEGEFRKGMEQMAAYLQLTSVTFGGFTRDVAAIWDDHHALVLASRCEGLPLVLVEAMLSGRVPVVTDVAGAREVVRDDATGFLAHAATEDALDEALERAWMRRGEWRTIGQAAGEAIRALVPEAPARVFAAKLVDHTANAAASRS